MSVFKHPLSQIDSEQIGDNTKIWQFVVVLKGAKIGDNCNICSHCYIENEVLIGNNVTVKAGVYLWDGIELQDNTFIGPNVVFTNDLFPRSKQFKPAVKTIIKEGASIGANSTILAGVTIGSFAMTGIASVITKDLKSHGLYYGNPARQNGWVDETGEKLAFNSDKNCWVSSRNKEYIEQNTGLIEKQSNQSA